METDKDWKDDCELGPVVIDFCLVLMSSAQVRKSVYISMSSSLYNWRLLAVDGVAVTRDDLLGFLPLGTKLSSAAASASSASSSNVLSAAKEAFGESIGQELEGDFRRKGL